MKRIVVVAAAIGLTAGAAALSPLAQANPPTSSVAKVASGAVTGAQVLYTPPPIKWSPCTNGLEAYGGECGFLVVPLNYKNTAGPKIRLAVSRIKHTTTADKYQGIMIVNPGGPGGSGLTLSVLGQYVPNHAGDAYDWIGFDPRGVGSSKPALSCDGSYFKYNRPSYLPTTPALENVWLNRSKAYSAACGKAGGALLNHVRTTDTVNDMDSIRKALGQNQINFYGFSYGTYLGQVYSTKYPNRVRRMVLDSNVDPRRVWYKANLDQDIAFDRNIKIYFAWIAKYNSVYHLGATEFQVQKLYYSELAKLKVKPAAKIIGPDEWTDIFLQAGYYVFGWEDVATAFSRYVNTGAVKPLKTLYDESNAQGPGADNGFAMYLGTQCTDVAWPKSWFTWRIDNWITYAKAPFETWDNAWFNAPCLTWPAKPLAPVTVNGASAPPILLIDETLDAATPYSGSLYVRSVYPKSALIEGVNGTTHAGSLFGDTCVDDKVAAYLADGTLPARVAGNSSDVQCPPLPQPDPTAAAPAAASKIASAGSGAFSRQALQKLIQVR